jgi:hypothetical protein
MGSKPASKALMILSTYADSSCVHRPVRYVLLIVDLVAAALFLSEANADNNEGDAFVEGYPLSCSRNISTSSNLATGNGRIDIDIISVIWHDGHEMMLILGPGNRISSGTQVCQLDKCI